MGVVRRMAGVLRRSGLVAHPLRRPVDSAEAALMVVLVVVFVVVGAAAAAAVGTAVFRAGAHAEKAQAAERQHLTAIVEDPRRHGGRLVATARWTGPDGSQRAVQVAVTGPGRPGAPVRVWIDQNGRVVGPPRSRAQTLNQTGACCVVTLAGIAFALWEIRRAGRRRLDQHRSARWASMWAGVEPHWSGRR